MGEIRWSENAIYICAKTESENYIWKKAILHNIKKIKIFMTSL